MSSPRLVNKGGAAAYLGDSSIDTVDRLINTGQLPIVRLPVERGANGKGRAGVSRRVLIDVRDLDRLIDASKEVRGGA
jgi:hypothetical protein